MLSLDNVNFSYSRKPLFKGLDLELTPGNIYGLLGKNGAGKTTLLKIMGGLLFPENGSVVYGDSDVTKREPSFLQDLFFLPEEFFLPAIKGDVFVNLKAPFYPNFNRDMFNEFVNEFDVDTSKALNTLSFGQKKKFLLSFGLATGTSLVIMDEPTNGLDIPSKAILRRIIARAMDSSRMFLISTHQIKDVENLIDPLIILDSGKIIFKENLDTILSKIETVKVPALTGDEAYSQETIGGYEVIRKGSGEENIDFELLFTGVISSPDKINELLEGKE